jgi:Rnl2 family RNA ligase
MFKPAFSKFSSIDNLCNSKVNSYLDIESLKTAKWVALEKIHGANYSVCLYTDNSEVKIEYSKRTSHLGNDTTFFNHGEIDKKYRNNFVQLYKNVKSELQRDDSLNVTLRGEIFGGIYTGLSNKFKKIQDGVFYTNGIEFAAFDIEIDSKTINDDTRIRYCEESNVPYIKQLHTGSLEELIKLSPEFESTIYSMFDHPKLDNNKAEGLIIKPVEPFYLSNGQRVILKHKSEKFKETRKSFNVEKLHYKSSHLEALTAKITHNRKNNVISKYGNDEFKNSTKLKAYVINDAITEYIAENPEFDKVLKEKIEKSSLMNALQKVDYL